MGPTRTRSRREAHLRWRGGADDDGDAFPGHPRALPQREGDGGLEATPTVKRSEVAAPDVERPPDPDQQEEGARHQVTHQGAHLEADAEEVRDLLRKIEDGAG